MVEDANPDMRPRLGAVALRSMMSPRTALVLGIAAVLLVAAAVALAVLNHDLSQAIIVLPFGMVGYVIARRQPHNPIGWILLAMMLAFCLSTDGGGYALLYYHRGYTGLPLARVGAFLGAWWIWLLLLLPLPIGLFPDGRISRRWSRVIGAYLALCAIFVAGSIWQDTTGIVARHIEVDSNGQLLSTDRSLGGPPFKAATAIFYAVFCVVCVARLVVCYRRSVGEYHQQLKWVLSAGAISIVGLILAIGINNSSEPVLHFVGFVAFLSVAALPVGIGVGILKYRLYEIDRLISRTISYLLITALLAATFVGLVILTSRVLPFSSPVAVAVATLAAAALFNPLRKGVQRLVDRRFNRAHYDAEATVTAFRLRLRNAADRETVQTDLTNAAKQAVEPTHAAVWVKRT